MTNNDIITSAAIETCIYTEEQAAAILASGHTLPLHTFAEWKARGYSVKKGEKAVLHLYLWKYTTRPSKALRDAAEAAGEELPDDPHYYKKLSHLFHASQVRRMDGSEDGEAGETPAAAPAEEAPAEQTAPVISAAPVTRSAFLAELDALMEDDNGQLFLG